MQVYNLQLFIFLHLLSIQSTCPKVTIFFVLAVEAKSTALITLQITRNIIYCKLPNKHQYFDVSALGRP